MGNIIGRSARVFGAILVSSVAGLTPTGLSDSASAAIYWQSSSEKIGRANLDGSNLDPDFITLPPMGGGTTQCGGVAVDAGHIYWADNQAGTMGRANLDGTNTTHSLITGASRPCAVTVDSSYIYWADFGGESIGRAGLDGQGEQPRFIPLEASSCGVANSATHLYWSSSHTSSMGRAGIGGNNAMGSFLGSVDAVCSIALSDEHIYWATPEGIGRARLNGTEKDSDFISGLTCTCALAVHDGHIYWSEQPLAGTGSISRALLDGSNVERGLISGFVGLSGIAVDDTFVPPPHAEPQVPPRLSMGPTRQNRRTGSIFVGLKVTVPGSLYIDVPRQIHARLLDTSSKVSAGRHWLRLSLGPGSKQAWPRNALRQKGWVAFLLRVGFVPGDSIPGGPGSVAGQRRTKELRMWKASPRALKP